MTMIKNFLKFARTRGVHPGGTLYLSDLRQKVPDDERSARLAFTDDDVRILSQHPIWKGCRNESRRNLSGDQIIKDGLFWGPIIAAASGARREEIMGLAVSDVDVDVDSDIPHILIFPNEVRRLKNASSCRSIPIHSRLIDLGFFEYVRDMQRKNEVDLFPELKPDNPTCSYGGVFYKPWKSAMDMQLQDSSNRKTFHSFHHRVITILRHLPEVDKAWVKDLVGHRHGDEMDGRYRDPTPFDQLQTIVEKIPVIF